jgi:hypothetical protein
VTFTVVMVVMIIMVVVVDEDCVKMMMMMSVGGGGGGHGGGCDPRSTHSTQYPNMPMERFLPYWRCMSFKESC